MTLPQEIVRNTEIINPSIIGRKGALLSKCKNQSFHTVWYYTLLRSEIHITISAEHGGVHL